MADFEFVVRETLEKAVTIEADSIEEAEEKIRDEYFDGNIDVDQTQNVEFLKCCSRCGSMFEYDDEYRLREVIMDGKARLLCDLCVERLEENGDLTRCKSCHEIYEPAHLEINPKTESFELCPYCGEIWCE